MLIDNGINLNYMWLVMGVNSLWMNKIVIYIFDVVGVYVVFLCVENYVSIVNIVKRIVI